MAYVVARRDGRYEVRECIATSKGPRSRTLAAFRVLSPGVLDHAEARATRPFDRDRVAARARALGSPEDAGDTPVFLAWRLLTQLGSGHQLPQLVADALRVELGGGDALPDTIPPLIDWLGASAYQRGDALRDLLRMTDRVPPSQTRPGRRYPRIASSPV
jgi:hypothetical protein